MINLFKNISAILLAGTAICIQSCKKDPNPPSVTTDNVKNITSSSALSGGNVTGDGGAEVSQKGVCWNTSANPTINFYKTTDGPGTGSYESSLSNLQPGTTYYVRSYATNAVGTAYGNEVNFATTPRLAIVNLLSVTFISPHSYSVSGNVIGEGGATVTTRGICWNKSPDPTIDNYKDSDGTGTGQYTCTMDELSLDTRYYIRAFATNSVGTSYSEPVILDTDPTKMNDIDMNEYDAVRIGTQVWMADNLKTTHYNDGSLIPNVLDNTAWGNLTTGARCYYNNDSAAYDVMYGALYNWYALNTGKLCPAGWHVPSKDELFALINFLAPNPGGKLKETGTSHWNSPNEGATNESGFTALPGGCRYYSNEPGIFNGIGVSGYWWGTTLLFDNSWYIYLNYYIMGAMSSTAWKTNGYSVRCILD